MKCRICGNEKDNPEYEVKELQLGLGDPFTYFRCSVCGCLQISEIPEDMCRYYPDDYYSYNSTDKFDNQSFLKRWLRNQRDNYSFFKKGRLGKWLMQKYPAREWYNYLDWRSDMRILDVGCGNGAFLKTMKRSGFRFLTGIDPFNKTDYHFDKNFHIYKQSIDQHDGEYDVIVMSHSLEHMPDQQLAFKNIQRLLAMNGKVVVTIPMFCEELFNRYGKYWQAWDPPRHFYLHTMESLTLLVNSFHLHFDRYQFDYSPWLFTASEALRTRETGFSSSLTEEEIRSLEKTLNKTKKACICEILLDKLEL